MDDLVNQMRIAFAALVLRDCADCQRCESCTYAMDLLSNELIATNATFRCVSAWRRTQGSALPGFGTKPGVFNGGNGRLPSSAWGPGPMRRGGTGERQVAGLVFEFEPPLRPGRGFHSGEGGK